MRQRSLFVRLVGVCLLSILFSLNVFAQTDKITEGSLRVVDAEGKERGLCPLKQTDVRAEISGMLSRVTVTQTFQNPFAEKIEAVYTFPLPNDAAVDDMTIRIGERFIKSRIMESTQAAETYQQAIKEGKTAALLEQQRPNIFTQTVGNITPNAEVKVIISYVETLKYADGIYEFAFPMTVGERYIPLSKQEDASGSSETGVADASKISPARTEESLHRVSLEVKLDAGVSIESLASGTHEIEAQRFSASRFLVRLKNEGETPNRDFVLKYKTAGERIEDAVLTHRDARGGFFTLVLQPPDRVFPADATPKEIVFVLDTSGSMNGFPIEKAKEAMMLSLNGLNPQDTFNLITFAGDTRILFDAPVPANPQNLRKAKDFLSSRQGSGGTEMMRAIKAALDPTDSQAHIRIVCFMTDGLVGNEFEIINEVKNHPNARVFAFGIGSSVNRFLLDEISREGRGEVEYVAPEDDGSAAARRFFERVRNPLLTDISIDWSGLPVAETYPARLPDLFDAKPVVIAGRYTNGARGKIVLHGKMQGQVIEREIAVDFPETNADHDVLATLWARRKISDLMAQDLPGLQRNAFKDDIKKEIINLGMEYRLLTQFTSFVAVDEQTITENGVPRRVEVPVLQPNVPNPPGGAQNYTMVSGGVSSMVTVTTDSSVQIDTSDTKIATNITTETRDAGKILRGGGFQNLLSTASGITQTGENPFVERRGLVSSTGQRPTSNNFTVDGLPANLGVSLDESSLSRNAGSLPALTASGGTNSFTTLGQTQEITVKTLGTAKEQRVAGAEINIISTGGSNSFRGSLFEIFGNEKLNANDFFANSRGLSRADSRLNQFGGTLGGYIRKDRAWFFGGYEGLRLRQAGFNVSEVPTFVSRGFASGSFYPILQTFPVPPGDLGTSNGFTEFAAAYTNPAAHDIFGLRIDTQPFDKLRLGGRYNFAGSTAALRGDRDYSLSTVRRLETKTGSLSAWTTYTATPTIVMSGRLNFSRNRLDQQFTLDDFGGAQPFAQPSAFDFLKYDFAGKNSTLAVSNPFASKVDQFTANGAVDWLRSGHQFTFGADFRRLRLDPGAATTERSVLFSRLGPLSGTTGARVTELTRDVTENPEFNNFSVYAQHGWRINSRFNLNLGLRWDADFAPGIEAANIDFGGASLRMPGRLSNFAPRAGFAFDVTGSGKAVVRAGTGLYFDYGNGAASDTFANSFPFASGRYAQNVFFTATPTAPLRPLTVFDRDLKTPRTWHSFVEYQQEVFRNHIFSASYTSSRGRRLYLTRTLTDADPNYNYIRLTDNGARSDYNALELRFERRFSQGFSFNARYALAKSKDNFSPDSSLRETNFVGTEQEQERGSSDFEVRHQFNVYGVYDIPVFFDGGWAKRLTEDWSLSAFLNARTGYPLSAGYWRADNFGKQFVRAELVAGVPVYLDRDTIKRLNPNAFALPPAGAQGDLKRNSLRGFPLFQLDTSLQRRIRFTNEMRLELGISAFNVLNSTNFADMSGILGTQFANGSLLENEYFGRATSVFGSSNFTPFYLYGGARTIQLSAKFVF